MYFSREVLELSQVIWVIGQNLEKKKIETLKIYKKIKIIQIANRILILKGRYKDYKMEEYIFRRLLHKDNNKDYLVVNQIINKNPEMHNHN